MSTELPPPTPLSRVLATLRVGLHVLFVFLLTVGAARFLTADPDRARTTPVLVLVAALAGVYLAGTVVESRYPVMLGWLAVVTALWFGLVALSLDLVWLLFPLVLLFLHLLPRAAGLVAVVVLWAIAAFVPAALHPADWSAGSVLGPAIGTVLAVAIYYTYLALHREADHHRAVAQALRAAQDQLAASEHQAGQLEERERLSREIHDTVAQGLSSILLVSRAARGSLRRGDTAAVAGQLATIEEQATDNLAEARRFVRDLASPVLAESLPDSLRRIIDQARARQDALGEPLDLSLQVAGDAERPLAEPVRRTVLRAAQEAVANVLRHARGQTAVVTLTVWDGEVSLDVVDDGRGTSGDRSYGLRGLSDRVAALDGTLDIDSGDGSPGTTLTVRLPLTGHP